MLKTEWKEERVDIEQLCEEVIPWGQARDNTGLG